MQSNLTPDELKQLVEYLNRLEAGFLPYSVFVQVARLVTLPIIEFVPVRLCKNGSVEVLLIHRGKDDQIWPDEWHTPGTVVRSTDNEDNIYKAFSRIIDDELKGSPVGDPYYVGSILHKSKRGSEQAQVFWIEVLGEPAEGIFYDINSLPNKTMDSQLKFIQQAVKSFKKHKFIRQ